MLVLQLWKFCSGFGGHRNLPGCIHALQNLTALCVAFLIVCGIPAKEFITLVRQSCDLRTFHILHSLAGKTPFSWFSDLTPWFNFMAFYITLPDRSFASKSVLLLFFFEQGAKNSNTDPESSIAKPEV